MIPDLRIVIDLQSLDQRIGALRQEVAALPKHIAAIEKTLEQHLRKLEADRAALAANQKERKKLEGEIQLQEQKISKLRDQMLGRKITNEQHRAFQHEIEYCEKEIRKAEDRILDLMSESEPLEQNVKKAEAALQEEKRQVEADKQATLRRSAEDQQALERLEAERERAVAGLNPGVYGAYERIRKKNKGVAVAEAAEERCLACNMFLRPQFLQDLRRNEEIMFCESCGRILFCNPPAVVEEDTGVRPGSDNLSLPAGT